ncbi:hypothetical protein BUALT_Bualt13G0047000 [Buddleja alternifolia]|uniref:Cysteine proteinase inhibitor n=1 Tax=Buddleja alternifolia TaxID=168488 RepID=A0AAV6WJZ2_9LAMI|nr:hypothetical protein BUALT_Bualt13G0047000 [Buddleja alternifolia]
MVALEWIRGRRLLRKVALQQWQWELFTREKDQRTAPRSKILLVSLSDDHNNKQNALLEFRKVVNVKEQVVAGMVYYITIEAAHRRIKCMRRRCWCSDGRMLRKLRISSSLATLDLLRRFFFCIVILLYMLLTGLLNKIVGVLLAA